MNSVIEVLSTMALTEAQLSTLRALSPRLHITVSPAHKPEDIPADLWSRVEVLYTSRVLPAPEQAPNLRWIQISFAGIEWVTDAPILQKKDLIVTNLSGANATQVAEYAVMMMLALGHRLNDMMSYQARGDWPKDRWERFLPHELRDSTVGIVGYGSIGRQVAHLLQPFGVEILASKHDVMQPQDNGYIQDGFGDPQGDLFSRLYPFQAIRSMLNECDFVVLTVPLTPETRGMIGAEELSALKPGAMLVDVSRGGVLDHNALLAALQDKRLAGAALDVFPEEPLPATSPLWKLPNVIITPHISGISTTYNDRAVTLFAENLNRYLVGLPLYNRFDPEKGY